VRVLALLALAAATCTQPAPSAPPAPVPVPLPAPPPVPSVEPVGSATCESLWAKFVDDECPPADTHETWLGMCPKLDPRAIACLNKTDVCQIATDCLNQAWRSP
jgi:hypothetical protein